MTPVSRRSFLALSSGSLLALSQRSRAAELFRRVDGGVSHSFPAHEPDLVQQVVAKAHVDLEGLRTLVSDRPALAKASWDWGFGDWESALGAASHMGRRDIAEFLMKYGARPTVFTFAMLGQLDAVQAICESNPGIQRLHGPHGITLLAHARNGGKEAARVADYLEALGDADVGQPSIPVDSDTAQMYEGVYTPEGVPEVSFSMSYKEGRKIMAFRRDDRVQRFLHFRGDHAFNPDGAESVWLRFDVRDGRAASFTIHDGDLEVTSVRRP